jgi:hypothetical protein
MTLLPLQKQQQFCFETATGIGRHSTSEKRFLASSMIFCMDGMAKDLARRSGFAFAHAASPLGMNHGTGLAQIEPRCSE